MTVYTQQRYISFGIIKVTRSRTRNESKFTERRVCKRRKIRFALGPDAGGIIRSIFDRRSNDSGPFPVERPRKQFNFTRTTRAELHREHLAEPRAGSNGGSGPKRSFSPRARERERERLLTFREPPPLPVVRAGRNVNFVRRLTHTAYPRGTEGGF